MIYQALIVDDEKIVCRGLSQFIKWQEHGFEVSGTANSADDALSIIEKMHIDVVITDIRMPQKTGLDLIKILQREYPEIKSVILSGFADFSYAQEALRCGASDFLTKPVNLQEMERLLDRLREEFEEQQQQAQIRTNRLEALLLSAARGYSDLTAAKYDLPAFNSWYGVSMSLLDRSLPETEIQSKKEQMLNSVSGLIPASVLLDDEIFSLFCILPCSSDADLDSCIAMLEQFGDVFSCWALGVSKQKSGIRQLHEAWEEAGCAQRYRRAKGREGAVFYRNIEPLFSQSSPDLQDILPGLLRCLSDPENRRQGVSMVQESLASTLKKEARLTQYQTACIRFLIELNGYLQGLHLPDSDLHARLNDALGQLLMSTGCQGCADCVTAYLSWLIDVLDRFDDQSLGKGAIREIQLYIRQHYSENITLNFLAEQFFLHPNYLSRLFKEKTGKNFVEYLTEVRMEKVKELLRTSDCKIIEICAMAGYDNPRYFSKVFKQYTGMTPKEYREAGTDLPPSRH